MANQVVMPIFFGMNVNVVSVIIGIWKCCNNMKIGCSYIFRYINCLIDGEFDYVILISL